MIGVTPSPDSTSRSRLLESRTQSLKNFMDPREPGRRPTWRSNDRIICRSGKHFVKRVTINRQQDVEKGVAIKRRLSEDQQPGREKLLLSYLMVRSAALAVHESGPFLP